MARTASRRLLLLVVVVVVCPSVVDSRGRIEQLTLRDQWGLPLVPFGCFTTTIGEGGEGGMGAAARTAIRTRPNAASAFVEPALIPAAEVVHGLNTVAPYNDGLPTAQWGRSRLLQYLDRCAALGVMVSFSLCGAERWTAQELATEIMAVRGHRAILGYYIADEPDAPGSWVEPQRLRAVYETIKSVDPGKPVLSCFTDPSHSLRNFSGTFDVALVDPYPIGDCPGAVRPCPLGSDSPTHVIAAVDSAVAAGHPVILAGQAMGGAGRRERTPTAVETRLMATLGLIHGAAGVQWFMRVPPNGGPYAPSAWSEARQMALEVADITPALTSGRQSRQNTTRLFAVSPATVDYAAWREPGGSVLLIVANTALEPTVVEVVLRQTANVMNATVGAAVLFQGGRRLQIGASNITGGFFMQDMLLGFGTAYYRLSPATDGNLATVGAPGAPAIDDVSANLVVNGGFEDAGNAGSADGYLYLYGACSGNSHVSRKSPCTDNADGGATAFQDARTFVHGRHSLRLVTPSTAGGVSLVPYEAMIAPATDYNFSVWTRGAHEAAPADLRFSFGANFVAAGWNVTVAGAEWKLVSLALTTKAKLVAKHGYSDWARFWLQTPGVVWLDSLSLRKAAPRGE
jgi:hypothetical protein